MQYKFAHHASPSPPVLKGSPSLSSLYRASSVRLHILQVLYRINTILQISDQSVFCDSMPFPAFAHLYLILQKIAVCWGFPILWCKLNEAQLQRFIDFKSELPTQDFWIYWARPPFSVSDWNITFPPLLLFMCLLDSETSASTWVTFSSLSSQQCDALAEKTNVTPRSISRNAGYKTREVIILLYLALVRPHWSSASSFGCCILR